MAYDTMGTAVIAAFSICFAILQFLRAKISEEQQKISLIFVTFSLAIVCFAFAAGGDWMENGRLLVPAYVFAFASALVVFEKRSAIRYIGLILVVFVGELLLVSSQNYGGVPIWQPVRVKTVNFEPVVWEKWSMPHARDLRIADKLIGQLQADPRSRIVIGSGQAGLIMYYLVENARKEVRFVDFYGLSSDDAHECTEWDEDVYRIFEEFVDCVDVFRNYIFDIDEGDWRKFETLRSFGCKEIFREDFQLEGSFWKEGLDLKREFLVRC